MTRAQLIAENEALHGLLAHACEALNTAQGEAYLGTLDSPETPDPLASCHNVISVCLTTLAQIKEGFVP